jgi:hypothetical protein
MSGNSIRAILATTSLLALVLVAIGAANRGETAEPTSDGACESAVWPMIPATCFGSYQGGDVDAGGIAVAAAELRFVDRSSQARSIGASGKADLLQSTEIDDARYRTVETRDNGVSVLRRVKAQ